MSPTDRYSPLSPTALLSAELESMADAEFELKSGLGLGLGLGLEPGQGSGFRSGSWDEVRKGVRSGPGLESGGRQCLAESRSGSGGRQCLGMGGTELDCNESDAYPLDERDALPSTVLSPTVLSRTTRCLPSTTLSPMTLRPTVIYPRDLSTNSVLTQY